MATIAHRRIRTSARVPTWLIDGLLIIVLVVLVVVLGLAGGLAQGGTAPDGPFAPGAPDIALSVA